MFPYRVDNPRTGPAFATVGIIAANALVWLGLQGAGDEHQLAASLCDWGLIAGRLTGHVASGATLALGEGVSCTVGSTPAWVTPLTSMFMHGGWFHLLGNMWFLWLFGPNIEDAMGSLRFIAFYLLVGLLAASGQVLSDSAASVPMVGASGAISGVMGAYLILFPLVRVHMWIFLIVFFTKTTVPAWMMLLYWFMLQVVDANVGSVEPAGGGVAFTAHITGFIAGALLVPAFRNRERPPGREGILAGWRA